jgi:hypothetical protein
LAVAGFAGNSAGSNGQEAATQEAAQQQAAEDMEIETKYGTLHYPDQWREFA